jgi:hypothetical protein
MQAASPSRLKQEGLTPVWRAASGRPSAFCQDRKGRRILAHPLAICVSALAVQRAPKLVEHGMGAFMQQTGAAV